MAIKVLETTTKVSVKYPADGDYDLSAYSVSMEVKSDEDNQAYFDVATALVPLVDADDREAESVELTVTQIFE